MEILADLMTKNPTIYDFQSDLEGPLGTGDLGPHGGGHFTIGSVHTRKWVGEG